MDRLFVGDGRLVIELADAESPARLSNLAAIRARQPSVAKLLNATRIPDGVVPAMGRDGTQTYRIPNDQGKLQWLGGSSMPTVSAEEVFADFACSGCNVTLPGIMTGREPGFLLERMAEHCALFVWEEDPARLVLALQLHDYSAHLNSGRLVLLAGHDWVGSVQQLIADHPGYLVPTLMLTPPQHSEARIAALQREWERVASLIGRMQADLVSDLVRRLHQREPIRKEQPSLAVVSAEVSMATRVQAQRLHDACRFLGWSLEVCIPDAPDCCHLAARLSTIEQSSADWVLTIHAEQALSQLLPPEILLTEWHVPETGRGAPAADTVLADETEIRDRPRAEGGITIVESGKGMESEGRDLSAMPYPLLTSSNAVVALNLTDLRPEALNITLPSHVRLWTALLRMASKPQGPTTGPLPVHWLRTAEIQTGVELQEPLVRQEFLALIGAGLIPFHVARLSAEVLVHCGLPTSIWGTHWPRVPGITETWNFIPDGPELRRRLLGVSVLILPSASLSYVQLALDGVAAGIGVVLRTSHEIFAGHCPALTDLIPFLTFYDDPSELRPIVLKLTPDARKWQGCEAGRQMVRHHHTVAARLQAMRRAFQSA